MPFGLVIAEPGWDTITGARDKTAVLAAAGTWVLTAAPGLNSTGEEARVIATLVLLAGALSVVTALLTSVGVTTVFVTVLTRAMVAISTGEEARVIAALVLLTGALSVVTALLTNVSVTTVFATILTRALVIDHRIELLTSRWPSSFDGATG
jgi:F0F1-type ATP synthase assembly protein I